MRGKTVDIRIRNSRSGWFVTIGGIEKGPFTQAEVMRIVAIGVESGS